MRYTQQNKTWFNKKNAISYTEIDQDNIVRIKRVTEYLSQYNNRRKPMKLFDLGCGNGQVSKRFMDLGYDIYGIDISRENLEQAKKVKLKVAQGDVSKKLPYKNEVFDVVFAGDIIEHIFDTKAFLTEINRILKNNGLLVVTTPNLVHLPDRIKFLFGKSPSQTQPLHKFLHLHIRPFTFGSLRQALEATGFIIKKHESSIVVFLRNKHNIDKVILSSRILAKLFPNFGSFLIVYAVKSRIH